jgi:tripartite-type tricarboxylate transporter receptor subunit TctC
MTLTRRTFMATAAAMVGALPARSDDWPSRPIKLVVGTAPGGSPDVMARMLGDKLTERLGVSIIVENNSQGAGAVAQQTVAKASPDGYTMIMLTAGYPPQMALRKPQSFDPLDGFSFVTMVCGYPMVYAVAPDSPIKSFPDMIERAKAAPGRITYTINALGSIYHVLTKWIEREAGIEMTPVPYRGTAPAFTDVIAGRVDVMVEPATTAFARVQNGQLRTLALSSPGRYPLLPNAPTLDETLPGVSFLSWLGLAMPAGTPRPVVERINSEIRRALTLPDVQQRLAEGGNVATPSTSEEMREKIMLEMARWGRLIQESGIRTD